MARRVSFVWYYLIPYRKQLIIENLQAAFPEKSKKEIHKLTRDNLTHYCLFVLELLQLRFFSNKQLIDRIVSWRNPGPTYKALKEGKGALFLTAHVGNFEMFGASSQFWGIGRAQLVVKKMHSSLAEECIQDIRRRWVDMIPADHAIRDSIERLRENKIIGVMLDQHMGGRSAAWVDFMGRPAGTMTFLAVLAAKTGAPVLPAVSYRAPDGRLVCDFFAAVEFEEIGTFEENLVHNTQRYTRIIEGWVRRYPDQWFWIHRRWKTPDNVAQGITTCKDSASLSQSSPRSSQDVPEPLPSTTKNFHHPSQTSG